MELQLGKRLCETLLNDQLITLQSAEGHCRLDTIVEELLNSFPKYRNGDRAVLIGLKKRLARILSSRARSCSVPPERLKDVKSLLFTALEAKISTRGRKRKLKISKNREIYSSEQQETVKEEEGDREDQDQEVDDTGSGTHHIETGKGKKRKYKIYDHDFKETVCQKAVKDGIESACRQFKLPTRKISSWLEAYNLNLLGKGRKALDPVMEFHMCVWILKKIWEQVPLTQRVIRQKAATMKTNDIRFNGSKGWLQKFFLRHVELKSCFDTRSKLEQRDQCARYHRSAFARLLRDHENLLKIQIGNKVMKGDFQAIIYENGDHPALKLRKDKNLDQHKVGGCQFYDYQKLKALPMPELGQIKGEEGYNSDEQDIVEQEDEQELGSQQSEQSGEEWNDDEENEFKKQEAQSCDNGAQINIYEEEEEEKEGKGWLAEVKIEQSG